MSKPEQMSAVDSGVTAVETVTGSPGTQPDEQSAEALRWYVLLTYRYLRLGMVALVVFLGLAIGAELFRVRGECIQTSISAYYYTAAGPIFTSALLAVGICLIVIKGSTEIEDAGLNLAGLLAPVVALVPTPNAGLCARTSADDGNIINQNVGNNVFAYVAVGFIAVALVWIAWFKGTPPASRRHFSQWPRRFRAVPVVSAVYLAGALWWLLFRSNFIHNAHTPSAIVMFVAMIVVVGANANLGGRRASLYKILTVIMTAVVVFDLLFVFNLLHWEHVTLVVEAAEIVLFMIFWIVQTLDPDKVYSVVPSGHDIPKKDKNTVDAKAPAAPILSKNREFV